MKIIDAASPMARVGYARPRFRRMGHARFSGLPFPGLPLTMSTIGVGIAYHHEEGHPFAFQLMLLSRVKFRPKFRLQLAAIGAGEHAGL
jgi:hypothetical protein